MRILLIVFMLGMRALPALAQSVRTDLPITDGYVSAIARSGNTLFIGGEFDWVGPASGCALEADRATGSAISGFPKIVGRVRTIQPDGEGGWFVGGSFSEVDHHPRHNLAHILADHSVASWRVDTDIDVLGLALRGDSLIVCGRFTTIGGSPRSHLALVDSRTGVVGAWNPAPLNDVGAVTIQGGVVFGGDFEVDAWDLASGQRLWQSGNCNGSVMALAAQGAVLYVGGLFNSFGGTSRHYLASLRTDSGLLTSWNPNPNYYVYALATARGVCVAGGVFGMVGASQRPCVAIIDSSTGLATNWRAQTLDGGVNSITVADSTVYIAGYSATTDWPSRSNFAGLSITTAIPVMGSLELNGAADAVGVSGGRILVGGEFTGHHGVNRRNLAAIDLATGTVFDWHPDPNDAIRTLVVQDSLLFVAGGFTSTSGVARNGVASFGIPTGDLTAWYPKPNYGTLSLAVRPPLVYLGGGFTLVNGQPRDRLAAVDMTTGQLSPWNTGCPGTVFSLELQDSVMAVGGTFATLAGQARGSVGLVSLSTGSVIPWTDTRGAAGTVSTLTVQDNSVYVGGTIWSIGDQPRQFLGAVDRRSGAVLPWRPDASGFVNALAPSAGVVLVGGSFATIGGDNHLNFAAVDGGTGQALPWWCDANGRVLAILVSGSRLYVGGAFTGIAGSAQAGIAELDAPLLAVDRPMPANAGVLSLRQVSNPARGTLSFVCDMPSLAPLDIRLYDVRGRTVARKELGLSVAGSHPLSIDCRTLCPGIYFLKAEIPGIRATSKVVLLR